VRSSSDQSWLEVISSPPGTDHAHPERVSLRIIAEPVATKIGRRSSGIDSSP
jgi:hypothetical protein